MNEDKGFGIIEVVVGATIISLTLFGVISVFQNGLRLNEKNIQTIQAEFLIEEGLEAVRIMRDMDWGNIAQMSTSSDLFLTYNGSTWATTTTNVYIDNFFERKFVLNDLFRDANDDLSTTTGTYDEDLRLLTVTVSWGFGAATTSKKIETILSDSNI